MTNKRFKIFVASAVVIVFSALFVFNLKPLDFAAFFNFKKGSAYSNQAADKVDLKEKTGQKDEALVGTINSIKTIEPPKIILMFVGDMMLSRVVGEKIKKENNWQWPFLKIGEYLSSADLTFGNLEGPISARGANVGSIYSFRADPRVVEGLKYAGFDIVSVANNHMGDWGRVALEDTLKILKEGGIAYAGGGFTEAETHNPTVLEVKGIKIGFLAYTALGAKWTEAQGENSGITWLDSERLKKDVQRAKEKSDFIVVSIHFGEEYKTHSNLFQRTIAHTAIDAGAKLVIGHHPHVVEESEEYNSGYIVYSLGNFIFDQTFSKETMEGELLKVELEGSKIKNNQAMKINISKDFQANIE